MDWVIVVPVLLILSIGILVLYSLSTAGLEQAVFVKQIVFAAIGIVGMFVIALADYHYFNAYSRKIYFVSIGILLLVLFFGTAVRGTAGWIGFGSLKVQPVEFVKIGLIIFLASFISQKKASLQEFQRLIVSFILTAVIVLLVLRQPDLGSAVILGGIWFGMIFVSGISRKSFLIITVTAILVGTLSWSYLADYQRNRILNFLDPTFDVKGAGYNVHQAMVAVGSGGLTGKGIGHGSQSQLNFLPEKHTDFIFAAVAEELGIAGVLFVLVLYLALFYRLKVIASLAQDNFGYLVVAGIMTMLFLQVLINVGMNIGLVPVTGIPLPFLSYGGSSLLSLLLALGIVLSVNERKDASSAKATHSY